jgi:hypothetical protein
LYLYIKLYFINYNTQIFNINQSFDLYFFNINQKKYNTKNTISTKKTINIFSIGSVIKYFNLKQGKSIRRNQKGVKIFLNFLKNIFYKKYFLKNYKNIKYIYQINSFDYNFLLLKKFLYKIVQQNTNSKYFNQIFILFKISVCFTKKKIPKKKSIKKRITKSILLNFLKNDKQIIFF